MGEEERERDIFKSGAGMKMFLDVFSEEERRALFRALVRGHGEKGFSGDEWHEAQAWALETSFNATMLDLVLVGKVRIKVSEGQVWFWMGEGEEEEPPF